MRLLMQPDHRLRRRLQTDSAISSHPRASDHDDREVRSLWDDGGFGDRSREAALDGRPAPGEQSSGALSDVQFHQGTGNHPVCRRCSRQLGVAERKSKHRIVCGDATNEASVSLTLAGVRPHLMVTDPPYGVEYDANWRNERTRSDGTFIGARAVGAVANDEQADWRDAWALFPGDVVYVWHADLRARVVIESLESAGFQMRAQIIWEKQHFIIGRGDYHFQHEPCWYAVRRGKTGHWSGDRKQSTIWQIHAQIGWESARPDNKDKATGHSTQKPVECMRRPIENNSSPGQAVYDPFVGSGATIIAAEMTGRACHAIEISPAYCDVAVQRWMNFTGQTATRPDGTPYQAAHREPVPAD
jgi:DNA modification methylase